MYFYLKYLDFIVKNLSNHQNKLTGIDLIEIIIWIQRLIFAGLSPKYGNLKHPNSISINHRMARD